jgi:hypothetical protein
MKSRRPDCGENPIALLGFLYARMGLLSHQSASTRKGKAKNFPFARLLVAIFGNISKLRRLT